LKDFGDLLDANKRKHAFNKIISIKRRKKKIGRKNKWRKKKGEGDLLHRSSPLYNGTIDCICLVHSKGSAKVVNNETTRLYLFPTCKYIGTTYKT